jgi:hypothetical protein
MRPGRLVAALTVAVLALAASAAAQHLTVSFGAGGFFPSDETYRRVYGNGTVFAGDLWLTFEKHFGLATGFGRMSDSGFAVAMDGGDAEYPLSFRRTSIPIAVFYVFGTKKITARLAAGAVFHGFRETWTTVDVEYSDSKFGPRLALAVSAAVFGRLSLFCSATYDGIPTGAGSALAPNIDLGGFQVLGGLAFQIF